MRNESINILMRFVNSASVKGKKRQRISEKLF